MDFRTRLKQGWICLDGAMGTMLQARGLKMGETPEVLNLEKPELLQEIHQEYIQAGARPSVIGSDNTYIEVDLCHQHLWYYVNGELYLESDVVTGLDSDPSRQTPPGAFRVWSKENGRYLGTMEVQGYHTWVDYWMPIDHTGIGLHDLSRSAYGGDIYKTNGSHGCINLPLDVASNIYQQVIVGTPVFITP